MKMLIFILLITNVSFFVGWFSRPLPKLPNPIGEIELHDIRERHTLQLSWVMWRDTTEYQPLMSPYKFIFKPNAERKK